MNTDLLVFHRFRASSVDLVVFSQKVLDKYLYPASMLSRVLLPAPEGPKMAVS